MVWITIVVQEEAETPQRCGHRSLLISTTVSSRGTGCVYDALVSYHPCKIVSPFSLKRWMLCSRR